MRKILSCLVSGLLAVSCLAQTTPPPPNPQLSWSTLLVYDVNTRQPAALELYTYGSHPIALKSLPWLQGLSLDEVTFTGIEGSSSLTAGMGLQLTLSPAKSQLFGELGIGEAVFMGGPTHLVFWAGLGYHF